MKDEYDLSQMESRKNPYAKALKKQVTIRVRPDVIDYFKDFVTHIIEKYPNHFKHIINKCIGYFIFIHFIIFVLFYNIISF